MTAQIITPALISTLMFATGVVIDEKSLVPIGTVVASACSIFYIVWWVGRKLQKMEDQIEELYRVLTRINCVDGDRCRQDRKDRNL